jgi:hypothetical protein
MFEGCKSVYQVILRRNLTAVPVWLLLMGEYIRWSAIAEPVLLSAAREVTIAGEDILLRVFVILGEI